MKNFDEFNIMTLSANEMLDIFTAGGENDGDGVFGFSYDFNNKNIKNSVLQSTNPYGSCGMLDQLFQLLSDEKKIDLSKIVTDSERKDILRRRILFVDFSNTSLPDADKITPDEKTLKENKGARAAYMLGAFGEDNIGFSLTFEKEDGKEPETVRFVPFEKSASMARGSQISFIDSELLDKMSERLNIGIDFSIRNGGGHHYITDSLSKFYSYRGLYFTDGKRISSSYDNDWDEEELNKQIETAKNRLDTANNSEEIADADVAESVSALLKSIENASLNVTAVKNAANCLGDISDNEARDAIGSLVSRCSASLFVPDENSVVVLPSKSRDIRSACNVYTVGPDEKELLLNYDKNGRLICVGGDTELKYDKDGNPDEDSKRIINEKDLKKLLKISSEPFDGEGLISPDCALLINAQLRKKGYKKAASSFQIRMPFVKGMLHEADFNAFLSSDKNEFDFFDGFDIPSDKPLTVIDVFGIKRDLRKAKIIINSSMFKCEKWLKTYVESAKFSEQEKIKYSTGDDSRLDPMKFYFDNFKKYKHGLYISNTDLSIAGRKKIKLNYQFLNTLDLYEENINSFLPQGITVNRDADGAFSADYSGPDSGKCSVRLTFTNNPAKYEFNPANLTAASFKTQFAAFLDENLTTEEMNLKEDIISFVCGEFFSKQSVRSGIFSLIEAQKKEIDNCSRDLFGFVDGDETDAEHAGISFKKAVTPIEAAVIIDKRFMKDPQAAGLLNGKKQGLIGDIGVGRLTVSGEQRFLSRDLLSLFTEIFRSTEVYRSAKNGSDENEIRAIKNFRDCEEKFKLMPDKMFLPGSRIKMRSDYYYAMLRNPHLSREEHCALRSYSTRVSLDKIIVTEKNGNFILNRKFKTDKEFKKDRESGGEEFRICHSGKEFRFSSELLYRKKEEDFTNELKKCLNPDGCDRNEKLVKQIADEFSGKYAELLHVFFHNLYFGKLDGTAFIGYDSMVNDILSGADFDGDIVKISADPLINKAVLKGCYTHQNGSTRYERKSYIVRIPGGNEDKKPITRYPRYSNIRNSFSNRIGHLSNSAIKIGKSEYSRDRSDAAPEVSRCAMCTVAAGLEIDAAKTGIHPVGLFKSIDDECKMINRTPLNLYENDYFIDFKEALPSIMQSGRGLKIKSINLSTYFSDWFGKDTRACSVSAPNVKKRRVYDFSNSDERNIPSLDFLPFACAEMMCSGAAFKAGDKYAIPQVPTAFCKETDGCIFDEKKMEEVKKVIEAYNAVLSVSYRLYRGNEFRKKVMQKNAGTVRNIIKKQYDDSPDKAVVLDSIYGKLYYPEDDFYFERCSESIEKLYEQNWIFIPTKEQRRQALEVILGTIFGGTNKLNDKECGLLTNFSCGGYMLLPHILTDIAFSQDIVLSESGEEGTESDGSAADNIYYDELYTEFIKDYNNKMYSSSIRSSLRGICIKKIKKIIGTDNITAVIKYCWLLRRDCDRSGNFFWNCFRPEEIECWLKGVENTDAQ